MQFSNDNVTYSTPEPYGTTKPWILSAGTGTKTVYAKFKDAAGNWSTAYSDTIDLTDPYTKSLLHMNGTDGSTTFTDSASGGTHTWTAYGNAQIDTAQSKFGGASSLFDGTGDWIDTPDSADWAMGSGDFTVDFWFRRQRSGLYEWIFGQGGDAVSSISFCGLINDTNTITFKIVNGSTVYTATSSNTMTDTNWHHYAGVRDGNTLRLFIDGVQVGTANVTGVSVNDSGNKLSIGRRGEYTWYPFQGHIDEFRISKGIARWTSNFTPPANEY